MGELNETSMVQAFAESMLPQNVIDVGVDFAEIGLDQLYDILHPSDGIQLLREVPIVKTAVSAGKIVYNVASLFRMKKVLTLLQGIHDGQPDEAEVLKRAKAAATNEKWFVREVEEVIVYMDRQTSAQKTRIQAKIYLDYICGKIQYRRYIEYMDILDQLFLCDISQIIEYYDFECESESDKLEPDRAPASGTTEDVNIVIKTKAYGMVFELTKCYRLIAMGLMLEAIEVMPIQCTIGMSLHCRASILRRSRSRYAFNPFHRKTGTAIDHYGIND